MIEKKLLSERWNLLNRFWSICKNEFRCFSCETRALCRRMLRCIFEVIVLYWYEPEIWTYAMLFSGFLNLLVVYSHFLVVYHYWKNYQMRLWYKLSKSATNKFTISLNHWAKLRQFHAHMVITNNQHNILLQLSSVCLLVSM